MRNAIAGVFVLAVVLVACDSREVTIRGKVGFPQQGQITLTEIRQDDQPPVEATIELKDDYSYEEKIKIKEPGFFRLNFYNRQYINIVLDKNDLEVNVDGNEAGGFFEVKGSPDADLESNIQNIMTSAQKSERAIAIEQEFQGAARLDDREKILKAQEKYKVEIMDQAFAKVAETINNTPASLGLINLLQNRSVLDRDEYFSVYKVAAEKCRKELPNNYYSKGFVEYVEQLKKTAVGEPAPEIALPGVDGKILSLSSLRGKFILVDFWAKWCGPCRQENPNVVRAYNEFKDKGFDILGVSLDRAKEDWLQAIQEDGLTWNHVSDLRYFESQAAKDYNINAIPASILVDPKGIIIAKNLRGPALKKKLEEVLN